MTAVDAWSAVEWAEHVVGREGFTSRELADFLIQRNGSSARILDVLRAGGWHRVTEEKADGSRDPAFVATPEPPALAEARSFAACLATLGSGE